MGEKRKRGGQGSRGSEKRLMVFKNTVDKGSVVGDSILTQYYPRVLTLRAYLLLKLPTSSKARRRKVACLGHGKCPSTLAGDELGEDVLADHLDKVLIGVKEGNGSLDATLQQQWLSFSQRAEVSEMTESSGASSTECSQSEVSIREFLNVGGPSELVNQCAGSKDRDY
jgi:hypothetical protein